MQRGKSKVRKEKRAGWVWGRALGLILHPSYLPVDIPPVADMQDGNKVIVIIDFVYNPVIPGSDSQAFTPGELSASSRPGRIGKFPNGCRNSVPHRGRQSGKLFLSTGQNQEFAAQRRDFSISAIACSNLTGFSPEALATS